MIDVVNFFFEEFVIVTIFGVVPLYIVVWICVVRVYRHVFRFIEVNFQPEFDKSTAYRINKALEAFNVAACKHYVICIN